MKRNNKKKKEITVILLSVLAISNCICLNVKDTYALEIENVEKKQVEFDLWNFNRQEQTIYVDGKTITISMSEELDELKVSPLDAEEYIPWGDFKRKFEYTDGVTKMSAIISGFTNPHLCRVDSVEKGEYNSLVGAFIRDCYDFGQAPNDSAAAYGQYIVDYTTYLSGTYTATFTALFLPSKVSGTRVLCSV